MSSSELPPDDAVGTAQAPDDTIGEAPQPGQIPLLNALLGSLGGGQVDPMSLLLSQLGGATANDPRAALLTQFLSQRRQPPVIEGEAEEVDPAAQEEAARHRAEARAERARRIRELRALVKTMHGELQILRVRNDTLAAALGACHICFGSDPSCEECEGRGIPGSLDPDPDAYREFVAPAVRRAQRRKSEREHRAQRYLDPRLAAANSGVPGWPVGQSVKGDEARIMR